MSAEQMLQGSINQNEEEKVHKETDEELNESPRKASVAAFDLSEQEMSEFGDSIPDMDFSRRQSLISNPNKTSKKRHRKHKNKQNSGKS